MVFNQQLLKRLETSGKQLGADLTEDEIIEIVLEVKDM